MHAKTRRHLATGLLAIAAALLFRVQFTLGVNATRSLPTCLFLVHHGEPAAKGQYVAFRWQGGGGYAAGTTFVKIVAGVPGDTVTREGNQFLVNGQAVGTAKPKAISGEPLQAGPTGVIPAGHYYVRAPHPDSLDSRYAMTGWVSRAQLVGRAYALF